MSSPLLGQAISTGVSGFFGWLGAKKQHKRNLELAQFQANANERYLQKQLEWDSPKNQMARFQEAGLNPHLIYGQGSPGNQGSPLTYPDVKPTDWQGIAPQAIQSGNQSALVTAQIQATNAKTVKDTVQAGLARLQARVLERNPLLDDTGFAAIISGLVSTADIKASQATESKLRAGWFKARDGRMFNGDLVIQSNMSHKMDSELRMLEQKFDLGTTDQKIKGQILSSKEFQNAILEVQKRWLTEADVTPQHIYQFIQMLLMKLL